MSHADSRPNYVEHSEDGPFSPISGAVCVQDASKGHQLRLYIVTHTSTSGPRAASRTSQMLHARYSWRTLETDIITCSKFSKHSRSISRGGQTQVRGVVQTTARPQELYCSLNTLSLLPSPLQTVTFLFWVTTIKTAADSLSFRELLSRKPFASAPTVVASLMCPWVNVKWSNPFQKTTLRLFPKGLRILHHITMPQAPLSNIGMERMRKEFLRIFRATAYELQMTHDKRRDV